jgi:hypothetical protein
MAIASRLLAYASNLNVGHQEMLLSFICGGSPPAARIARWIAYNLLVEGPASEYSALPALDALRDTLSAGDRFVIDEETDYETLNHLVAILAVALTDIDGYVAQGRSAALASRISTPDSRSESSSVDTPVKTGPTALLDEVKLVLDVLHNLIVDTRAAHLDRSRAKASLQRLSHRLAYQTQAALRPNGPAGKPRRIQEFWPRANPE